MVGIRQAGFMAEKTKVVLRVRPPAFGLPTGCPRCLPSYLYLRLAHTSFNPDYCMLQPDSEDLPIVEFGQLAGFANECGGVEEFLRTEKLADLDIGLTELEKSELLAFKSLLIWLSDALTFELWSKENEAVVGQIYLSQLPWPINKAVDWNMRRKIMIRLGFNKDNATDRVADIYRNASKAYEALSAKRQDQLFFLHDRPTSLDAWLLAHLLFVLSVPLEGSVLKEELNKHENLVRYAETVKDDLLKDGIPSFTPVPPASPKSPPRRPSSPKASASSSKSNHRGTNGETKGRKQTPKEKAFKKKAKQFLVAQIAAVVVYVFLTGLQYEDDDDSRDDD